MILFFVYKVSPKNVGANSAIEISFKSIYSKDNWVMPTYLGITLGSSSIYFGTGVKISEKKMKKNELSDYLTKLVVSIDRAGVLKGAQSIVKWPLLDVVSKESTTVQNEIRDKLTLVKINYKDGFTTSGGLKITKFGVLTTDGDPINCQLIQFGSSIEQFKMENTF